MTPSATARQPGQPLLTIAVPTWNRAKFLRELLASLLPQLATLPADEVELLISDNGSDDETPHTVQDFLQRGLRVRYVRNEANIGSDANFVQCFNLARGQYAFILGDDDILMPHALSTLTGLLAQVEVDIVFLSNFAFTDTAQIQPHHDRFGRTAELVTDGAYFLWKVNALIGLISANIVNKNRLLATPHPPIAGLIGTNLTQVGWLFPLLHRHCEVLYVWERLLAYRAYNSGGWGAMEVFGVRLERLAQQYFAAEPALSRALIDGTLSAWMCDSVMGLRSGLMTEMNQEDFVALARGIYGRQWRFWVCVYPVAEWPMLLARIVYTIVRTCTTVYRAAQAVIRHLFHHGRYLSVP